MRVRVFGCYLPIRPKRAHCLNQCAYICRSIAQGCSEYNITVLIDQRDSVRALRAVHGRFYLATLPLGVGLVGPGLIGGTFLDQIHQQMTVHCLPLLFSG